MKKIDMAKGKSSSEKEEEKPQHEAAVVVEDVNLEKATAVNEEEIEKMSDKKLAEKIQEVKAKIAFNATADKKDQKEVSLEEVQLLQQAS